MKAITTRVYAKHEGRRGHVEFLCRSINARSGLFGATIYEFRCRPGKRQLRFMEDARWQQCDLLFGIELYSGDRLLFRAKVGQIDSVRGLLGDEDVYQVALVGDVVRLANESVMR